MACVVVKYLCLCCAFKVNNLIEESLANDSYEFGQEIRVKGPHIELKDDNVRIRKQIFGPSYSKF